MAKSRVLKRLWQEVQELADDVALPVHAATRDHKLGICIWEGESVPAVREIVEGVVGPYSDNEYFEMDVDGLTPQLRN